MYTYRYTGDLPTVFIHLRKDDATWCPSKNDTITLPTPIAHPLLVLVPDEPVVADDPAVDEALEISKKPVKEPAVPENTESPVPTTVDESKEN